MNTTNKSKNEPAKIYMAQIWRGDFSYTRIFKSKRDAENAIARALKEAEAAGEYISDTAICEMVLEGGEFLNAHTGRPEF